jgi:hypothetical protein
VNIGSEERRSRRPSVICVLYDRRRFVKHEAVIDEDRHPSPRIEGRELRSPEITGGEGHRLEFMGNSFVLKGKPGAPRIRRA